MSPRNHARYVFQLLVPRCIRIVIVPGRSLCCRRSRWRRRRRCWNVHDFDEAGAQHLYPRNRASVMQRGAAVRHPAEVNSPRRALDLHKQRREFSQCHARVLHFQNEPPHVLIRTVSPVPVAQLGWAWAGQRHLSRSQHFEAQAALCSRRSHQEPRHFDDELAGSVGNETRVITEHGDDGDHTPFLMRCTGSTQSAHAIQGHKDSNIIPTRSVSIESSHAANRIPPRQAIVSF